MLDVARVADGAVAVLTLARPEKRNALSIELREAFTNALRELGPAVRCVVVTGAGSAFCAGMDVTQFGGDRAHRERLLEANDAFFAALRSCPSPLVAAVNGPALGGGFALALMCDIRLAGPTATFGFPEIGRGVPPSLGSAQSALAPAVAQDLCLTGRVVGADEALRLGIASEVADDVAAHAVERASGIAALPPRAVRQVVAWARAGGDWRSQLERERSLLRDVLLRGE